ncbi:MFS transporter [Gordonia sp. zg691]|uniref:MFS transporter n=1 Tax=Gordonia jinghuaiqii TaxID=2758710 RepID=A0A7D7R2I0_9ACTN|nr:MFS transporter [Gordonia jinghuaiqii]MBD0860419.1 MFS transporter [Gordonia jinghuaiqii]MCR5978311.1 MFS transporter [Gordonia jinghuaiqii]QMT01252.1 MFS transporter [Gordonia jinghuaiqii]
MTQTVTPPEKETPEQRSGRRHAFAGAYLGWMFDGYETFATVLVASFIVSDLVGPDASAYYVGGILAITLLSWAIGGLVSGVLADRYGRRRVMIVSILWYSVCAGLTALAPAYGVLLLLRFLTGLGMGAEWGGGSSLVAETAPPKRRGLRIALLQSGFGVGFLIATGVWQLVNQGNPGDWRWMYALGVVPALLVLYIRRAASDSPLWVKADQQRRAVTAALASGALRTEQAVELIKPTISQVFSHPVYRRRVVMLSTGALASMIGWWAVSTWIPAQARSILVGTVDDVPSAVTLVVLTYNAAGVVGYLVNGWLADLVGRKPVIFTFFLASVAVTPCMFLLPDSKNSLVFWAAVNGFFTLGQMTWLALYPSELFPTNVRATGMTLVFNLARFPAAIGALISASLITAFGSISSAAVIIGCAGYGLGVLVTWFMGPETRGTTLPAPAQIDEKLDAAPEGATR